MHFGAGHFYAREFYAGSVLLLGELWLWVSVFNSGESDVRIAFGALAAVTTFDLVDGILALQRRRTGRARKPVVQLGIALAVVAASVFTVVLVVSGM